MAAALLVLAAGFGQFGTAAGLTGFGALADAHGEFDVAAAILFVPAAVAVLFRFLPETNGRELEDWAQD